MIFGHTDSGMQYAVRRGWSQVAYCALSIKCGTRSEGHFHNGIAHFAEHTVFKGTDKRSASAISSCLDKLGGELNAYTTKEEIVIHATVLKEDLKKAVSLLMDLAVFPSFPENEIETEKGVVIDEIKSYKDSPSEEIYDRFEELLFKGHPLSLPILGTAASVRKISSGELRAFVKEKFVPEMMALTIVADIPAVTDDDGYLVREETTKELVKGIPCVIKTNPTLSEGGAGLVLNDDMHVILQLNKYTQDIPIEAHFILDGQAYTVCTKTITGDEERTYGTITLTCKPIAGGMSRPS